jgi:putative hydrolase of the HAD superfamily
MASLEAITFDYWNTIVREDAERPGRVIRIEAWLGLLEEEGVAITREQLEELFEAAGRRFDARWVANDHLTGEESAHLILDDFGRPLTDELRHRMVDAFVGAHQHTELTLTDNVAGALRDLGAAGVRLGIVCDVGITPSTALRDVLQREGILELFDHWSFSDEVGVYKPDPVIFRHALDGLGVRDPSRAAHVGDLRRTDVAGARAMGMTTVRYSGVYDDDAADLPEADHVVADHAQLFAALGLASSRR